MTIRVWFRSGVLGVAGVLLLALLAPAQTAQIWAAVVGSAATPWPTDTPYPTATAYPMSQHTELFTVVSKQ